ncbi:MAG: hypothetical protein Q4Q07_04155 [Tissierellia bacterium]|nr:hypothetical protein [Tissierellia bacterium]
MKKNIFTRLMLLALLLALLIPSASFANVKVDGIELTPAQLKEIADTIDFSDKELKADKFSRMATPTATEGADFKVYHRDKDKLSMSDGAFKKAQCTIERVGDNYEFTLYTQPVSKTILGKTYWADPTEIHFRNKAGDLIQATAHGDKKAVNSDKRVPEFFTITMPVSDFYDEPVGGYNGHYKIWFETNLADSGGLAVVGDKMMNRNARLAMNK